MKKKLAVLLGFALAVSLAVPALATESEDLEPVTTVVEVESRETIPIMEFNVAENLDVNMPYSTETEVVESESAITPLAVSTSKDFSVSVGKSWSASFNTGKLLTEDHNAFTVVISGVTGTYKVIITDDYGYEYVSSEYTNTDITITTTNAASYRTFTVYIVNTGSTTLTGHVKISSYYAS